MKLNVAAAVIFLCASLIPTGTLGRDSSAAHLLYITNSPQNGSNFFELRHTVFRPAKTIEVIDAADQIYDGALAVDNFGAPHFAWVKIDNGAFSVRYRNGSIDEVIPFNLPSRVALALHKDGSPMLVVMADSEIYLTKRTSDGWSNPTKLYSLQVGEEFGTDLKIEIDNFGYSRIGFVTVSDIGGPCFIREAIASESEVVVKNIASVSAPLCFANIDLAIDNAGTTRVISSVQKSLSVYASGVRPITLSASGISGSLNLSGAVPIAAYFDPTATLLTVSQFLDIGWHTVFEEPVSATDISLAHSAFLQIGFINNGNEVRYRERNMNLSTLIDTAPFIYDIEIDD